MLTLASSIVFGVTFSVLAVLMLALWCMASVRRQRLPEVTQYPGISVIKPLAGLDDELRENLESHLVVDYPGPWEILVGLRSEKDAAYPVARAFADAHPERVRLVLQQGEPGYNPKVNQLITLTREARYEIIALTDSNVRVAPSFLREVAGQLARPEVGIVTAMIAGVGERGLGAVLDNMTLAVHAGPFLAAGLVLFKLNDLTGKAMAMRKDALQRAGGWHSMRNILAEDAMLGRAFGRIGLRVAFCPTPIQNVQVSQPLPYFWKRHTRWLLIRYRNLFPAVLLEPLLLPTLLGLVGALCSPGARLAWVLAAVVFVLDVAATQACGVVLRGHGFKLGHLLLVPLREAMFFGAWVRAATMDKVSWRGNEFHVLGGTRLAPPAVVRRASRIRRRH